MRLAQGKQERAFPLGEAVFLGYYRYHPFAAHSQAGRNAAFGQGALQGKFLLIPCYQALKRRRRIFQGLCNSPWWVTFKLITSGLSCKMF